MCVCEESKHSQEIEGLVFTSNEITPPTVRSALCPPALIFAAYDCKREMMLKKKQDKRDGLVLVPSRCLSLSLSHTHLLFRTMIEPYNDISLRASAHRVDTTRGVIISQTNQTASCIESNSSDLVFLKISTHTNHIIITIRISTILLLFSCHSCITVVSVLHNTSAGLTPEAATASLVAAHTDDQMFSEDC
jgi:hypothetical protein